MLKHCINSLFYNLEQTSRICRTGCEKYFEEHAKELVTFDEFIILDTIYCYPDICQRDLAKKLLKGASHTSKILGIMESKNLIERPLDKKGNRAIRKVVMTEQGKEAYHFASELALKFAKKIENSIGKNKAIECSNFLNKIKTTITASVEIDFE